MLKTVFSAPYGPEMEQPVATGSWPAPEVALQCPAEARVPGLAGRSRAGEDRGEASEGGGRSHGVAA